MRFSRGLHAVALAIAAVLVFLWLGSVPGLNGDEAWAGLRAAEIAHGAFPLLGMTPYTGPFQQYLVALAQLVFGPTVFALRIVTAVFALATVHLYFEAVRRLYDEETAAIASLALVTFPFFALDGRLAAEIYAFGPFLALAAGVLLLHDSTRAALGAGILLALGVWNHLVFAPVLVAYAVIAGIARRRALLESARAKWAVGGFAAVMIVRLLAGGPGAGELAGSEFSFGDLILRIREWPGLFARILHGDILFLRFTGEVRWATPPIAALAVLAGVVAALRRRDDPTRRTTLAVLLAFAIVFAGSLVLSPGNSDRYFLLPLYFAPLFAGLLLREVATARARVPALAIAAAIAVLQLARVGVDYFATFRATGGREVAFTLGSMDETSNHYVRLDELHRELVDAGVKRVVAEFHVGMPLHYLDLAGHHYSVTLLEDLQGRGFRFTPADRLVVYAGGLRRFKPENAPALAVLGSDGKFVFMGAVPTPTPPPE